MRRLTELFVTLALVFTPTVGATEGPPDIPEPNPQAKIESVESECERKFADQSLGELDAATYCTVYAWSELGRLYPDLLEVARTLQRKYNVRSGTITELRKQLRRERQQSDQLSAELGTARQRNRRLEGRWPTWLTWALTVGALVVGGGAGYGLGQLFSRREQAVSAGGLAVLRTHSHAAVESRRRT